MSAIEQVMARSWADSDNRRPAWAAHVAELMGKAGTWEVMYRNPDLRGWLEARNPDFALYAMDRDLDAEWREEQRAAEVNAPEPAAYRYCRCSNCGSINFDPIIRLSDEAPV